MKEEITAAVAFLTRLIDKKKITPEKAEELQEQLIHLLTLKFESHWFPENPCKGQGYRCIRVNENSRRDTTLESACEDVGIKYEDLKLPLELTLWVDPEEVTCRFGEHKGSYCIVANFKDGNEENYVDDIDIEELEQKSVERAKQASFDLVTSRKRKHLRNSYGKNGYHIGMSGNGLYSGLDYANGLMVTTSSPYYSPHHATYYGGSPKFGPTYGSSPSPHSLHQTPTHPNSTLFTPSYPMSPNSASRSLGATPYRGQGGYGNNGSTAGNGTTFGGNKFSRGLHSAFNNAALAFGSYQQSNDRYHWINKSIVKA